ncbi:hypothetical protein BU26DRAFT_557924 [Trematosphaeria pertusa]|uniref:Uncharacterized protein n=1 Tax=Trematosphaeria pertusa TaxID=390896 RepID=A0A6A6J2A6_9PLEO|nr:uncharacterized protein BU26DRAFT_557924 [Trematosphaeria pertusa]KAF2256477.1 hypothetical protein BU26DRAFT_557924 [Trematosphaeria pertusa]
MPSITSLFTLCILLAATNALPSSFAANTTNLCPTDTEYACFDVINSSLCLSQNAAKGTAEQMAACVDYPGGMSDLPGASKVGNSSRAFARSKRLTEQLCRCPGCHATTINDAIAKLFPPPCS